MFCVECGKEGKIYKDGLCVECYLKNHSFTSGPKSIDIGYCSHCDSYKYKNTWFLEPFEAVLKKWIFHYFQISKELTNIVIKPKCQESSDGMHCKILINGMLEENQISEEHNLIVYLKKSVCDVCSKRFGGYHEAIIQVRADNKTLSKTEISEIQKFVENELQIIFEKGNRGLFITDIGIERGGVDFFISDKGSALTISKKIQKKYGGELKTSSKNIGMKDSRQIYRMTYLVRLPNYCEGNFINWNNSKYFISSISGSKVHLRNIINFEEKVVDSKELVDVNIIGGKELIADMIVVSQTDDEIQVMDQKNYRTYFVKKPLNKKIISKTVKIAKLSDEEVYYFAKNDNNIK